MRRLGMLVMAIILITGCNAMQSNMEEAERLWRETEKNIQKWAISTNVEASPAEKPRIIPAPAAEAPQKTLELVEEPAPSRHRRSLRQRPFLTSLLTLSRSQQNSPQSSQPNPHPIQPPSRKQATPHAHAGQG